MWFEDLTGFSEESPEQVRANLVLSDSVITSTVNGRKMAVGRLETPSLAEIRAMIRNSAVARGPLTLGEVVGDVQKLHLDPGSQGAFFQAASQFNLLEMVSPEVTPEAGVGRYEYDRTQGPACAIAAGAGTLFRNYFAAVNGQVGQSAENQIDCLRDVGALLGNQNEQMWAMRNGYALASGPGLQAIREKLAARDDAQRDVLRGALRIGIQSETEVTLNGTGHLVTQAYCSALPVAYSAHAPELWRDFARLILEAAYEATLGAAILNYANTGNNRVYLTMLGGGAFGNARDWILSSISRAAETFADYPLDVKMVSYHGTNPELGKLRVSMSKG